MRSSYRFLAGSRRSRRGAPERRPNRSKTPHSYRVSPASPFTLLHIPTSEGGTTSRILDLAQLVSDEDPLTEGPLCILK
ncbi:hypothetical protein ALC56_11496 [Trachymyrmex septentrionalis]|uniref:Uncharacterized protein n=1 Tax=Trachymyrmex septentrionalis TaxID=34720 RepID=A0A195F1P7_9HYME|nr:hypothetical protein ALC56_11496 [Trachymyrmex septentrionalis]